MPTDEEALQLKPQIERIARSVATRLNASRTVRDQLYDDAVGHVFSVYHKFDPQVASFTTWCFTVLRNHCVTLIREEAQRWKYLEHARDSAEIEDEHRHREKPAPSPAEEREERVPRTDLVALLDRHLEPLDRLLLAAYEGLLQRFGTEVADRWCREADRADAAAWRAIESLPQKQRKRAEAKLLGEEIDCVRTRLWRAMQKLKAAMAGGGGA